MDYRPERPQPPSYEEFWRKKYEREKAGKGKLKCVLVWLISILIAALVITAIIVVLWVIVFKKKDDNHPPDGNTTLSPGNQSISISTSTTPHFSTTTSPANFVLVNSTVELIGVSVSNVSTVTPNAAEDNSFFILDTASNTAIQYNEGDMEQIQIYFSKQQLLGCTLCRLHALQRRAVQQTYYDTDAIYCCSECAQSSTQFCNYYGTTISQALSPFLISIDIPTGPTNSQNLTILTKTNSHSEPPTITTTQYLHGGNVQSASFELNENVAFGAPFNSLTAAMVASIANTSWSPVVWYAWLDTGYYAQTVVEIGRTENDTCRMSINAPANATSTSIFLARKDVHDLGDNDAVRMVIFDKNAKIAKLYWVPCGPEPQVRSINFGNRTVLDLYVNPDGQLYTLETEAGQVWVQRFELVQNK